MIIIIFIIPPSLTLFSSPFARPVVPYRSAIEAMLLLSQAVGMTGGSKEKTLPATKKGKKSSSNRASSKENVPLNRNGEKKKKKGKKAVKEDNLMLMMMMSQTTAAGSFKKPTSPTSNSRPQRSLSPLEVGR